MAGLEIRELHPALGAEVIGLEPSVPLDDETVRRLREAFDARSVLVFRGLDIDNEFQRYLTYTLVGADVPAPDSDEAQRSGPMISNREEGGAAPYGRLLFHCDTMWAETPHPNLSLYGLRLSEPTVPTMFVSMGYGWDTLPDDLRARVKGLSARHGHDNYYPNRGGDDDVVDSYFDEAISVVRPVAYAHPRTGRTLLYVSQQVTMEIVGLPEAESNELLEELYEHLYAPEQILQHDWRERDLVIWDNIAAQHARGNVDLEGPERTLRKVFGPAGSEVARPAAPTYSKVASRG